MWFTMYFKVIVSLIILFYASYAASARRREGSPCVGEDNIKGTCVNLYKCPSAVVTYLYYNFGYEFIPKLPEVCSSEGKEPIVCCTDCFIDTREKSRGYILDRFGNLVNKRKGPPARAVCTEYFQTLPYPCEGRDSIGVNKILSTNETCHELSMSATFAVGGRDAEKREFPHMALIGYGGDLNNTQWLCGGTVISDRYILTAAHCSSAPKLGPITYAALGILKRSDPIETWQIYKVENITVHPEYKSPARYHDIALLKVDRPIEFSKDVLPACVQTLNITFISVQGVGWGRLGHRRDLADTLQVVELYSFTDKECGELFPPHRHLKNGFDTTTQTCYGNKYKIVDTCEGDSGGPLHIEYKNCQYTVTGVTSFGKDCGLEGGAGMYTRVQHYVPWIESIVWPHIKAPEYIDEN